MPNGVVLSRGAIASNLDALARAWAWTGDDVVVQALPLFHAHGLILGVLGTLRRNGTVRHLGRFDPASVADAFRDGGTMLFAVPTMYHRLADACKRDPALAADGLGNVALAWSSYAGGNYNLRLRFFQGGRWGPIHAVTASTRYHAHPSLAYDRRRFAQPSAPLPRRH